MALKDLLVHIDDTAESAMRVDCAVRLALAHEAHLTALCLHQEPVPPGSVLGLLPEETIGELRATQKAALRRAAAAAEAAMGRAGLTPDIRFDDTALADLAATVTLHARHADMVVLGQANPDTAEPGRAELPETVMLSCGRPVLIVPYIGPRPSLGRRVMIAWKASREAARAVNDALPLLRRADAVTVLTVEGEAGAERPARLAGADIALHLARHGVEVEAERISAAGIGVADAILSRLADRDSDLLVMGGYGRSRLRELLLGGVTRQILRSMTVPVLMSH